MLKASEQNNLLSVASRISMFARDLGTYDDLVRSRNQLPARDEDQGYTNLVNAFYKMEDELNAMEQGLDNK